MLRLDGSIAVSEYICRKRANYWASWVEMDTWVDILMGDFGAYEDIGLRSEEPRRRWWGRIWCFGMLAWAKEWLV